MGWLLLPEPLMAAVSIASASNASPAHGIPQHRLTIPHLIQRVWSRGIDGQVVEELMKVTAIVMGDFINITKINANTVVLDLRRHVFVPPPSFF